MGKRMTKEEYAGKRYGRLTVIDVWRDGNTADSTTYFLCKCDCGTEKNIVANGIKTGTTLSCGCYNRDMSSERYKKINYKHGRCCERLHNIWNAMLNRCYNETNNRYHRYGKRGITVCDEWRNDYEIFRTWALSNGYRDDLSIDRKDNDGDYIPSNCKFSTNAQQAQNRSKKRENVGVHRHGNKWQATITANKKTIYLGTHPTEKAALDARKAAELKYWSD